MSWYYEATKRHRPHMEKEIEDLIGPEDKNKYLAIFGVAVIIVGAICTILYFTNWKKESYEDEEENKNRY